MNQNDTNIQNNIDIQQNNVAQENVVNYQSNNQQITPVNKSFSKESKITILLALIGSLIMIIGKSILTSGWFFEKFMSVSYENIGQQHSLLKSISEYANVAIGVIVIAITILSIIFLIQDKKKQNETANFIWYIVAGLLHLIVGTIGLTPILYSLSTLIIITKHKKNFGKGYKFYFILSAITTIIAVATIITKIFWV